MFRFIHAADPHLDSPLRGLGIHEGAPVQALRGATRRAFENLVHLAIDEPIDFLVIAGDLYEGDWKDYGTGLFFRGQMVRLRDAGIYLIAGNHDAASIISKKLTLPENVHVFSTRSAESKEVEGHPVVIHGRGFPHRAVPENFATDYPQAVSGKFNLGLLHTSLTGRPGHDTYAPCSEQDLLNKGYDNWALGHIHQHEVISEDPWIVFAGSCQGRHARETGPHGCRLVTVNNSLVVESAEWRELDVVRWNELEVDLTGIDEEARALTRVSDAMDKVVAAANGRLVAARVVLTGATSLHGSVHREAQRWHAEILACAQEHGAEALWIERIRIATTPVYDVLQLAQRDALNRGVLTDHWVSSRDGHRLRLISYLDRQSGKVFDFLTNEPDLPPGVIAELYRRRWEAEKVFDEVKNKLGQQKAWATTLAAKQAQAHLIAITHNLLLCYETALERRHGVENRAEDQRRRQRVESAAQEGARIGWPLPALVLSARRATQRSVKLIRWLRHAIREGRTEAAAVPHLQYLYATM